MKIGVVGATGRMGRANIAQVAATKGLKLVAAVTAKGDADLGKDAGTLAGLEAPLGVPVTDDVEGLFKKAEVVIDFTRPQPTLYYAQLAAKAGVPLVSGTTGLDQEQQKTLADFAQKVPIVWAPNMSLGVTVLAALTEKLAGILDENFDIEIVEMHHRHKIDAPSGTALGLGHAAARGRGVKLDKVMDSGRHGHTGERQPGAIGFATLRGGDVVGDHTVMFAGPGERIELTHKASSREIFARGAVRAAQWVKGQKPGLYSMRDVLGI